MASKNLSTSVIIPNYNGCELLKNNLPQVIKACPRSEIIIVDDASSDTSLAFVTNNYPKIKIISLATNQRFAIACNIGVSQARGDIIILLNTDVSPKSDFLVSLLSPFADSKVFAVGCAEINHRNYLSGRSYGLIKQGLFLHQRSSNQKLSNTLWASGGSGAFRRSIWQKLGGFDPLFSPAYEEDRDICYRALKRGYQVKFAPQALVYHHHQQTNSQFFSQSAMAIASYKNHLLFTWKNITSQKMFLNHLLWLPYHLLFTSITSQGKFLLGFLWALTYLPRLYPKRQIEKKAEVVSDETIIAQHQA